MRERERERESASVKLRQFCMKKLEVCMLIPLSPLRSKTTKCHAFCKDHVSRVSGRLSKSLPNRMKFNILLVLVAGSIPAFATLLRRIIFEFEEGDERWLGSLKAAGFSDDDVKAIYDHVCDHSWLKDRISTEDCEDQVNTIRMDYSIMDAAVLHQ